MNPLKNLLLLIFGVGLGVGLYAASQFTTKNTLLSNISPKTQTTSF
jgi:hypothetical protein